MKNACMGRLGGLLRELNKEFFSLSSPKVSVGDLFLLKKENDRFPTTALGNDSNNHCGDNNISRNPAGRTLAGRQTLRDDDKKCIVSWCRFGGLRDYKNSVAPLIKRARTICRLQGRGFTLIELLVVVLIIGILAAMALPDYQRATEISRVGAALSFSRAFRDSVDRYYMQNGRFPSSPDALDVGLTQCPKYFSCMYAELTTQGKFQIDRKNGPFAYGIITRSAVSPALPNTIYCYALRSNKKGVEFCEHWGEDATPEDGTWFRTLIQ